MEEGNASVDARGHNSETSLHLAAKYNTVEVVRFLVEEGNASLDTRDRWSDTPLHEAARSNTVEVVQFLVEEGNVSLDARDRRSNTPLHLAARSNTLPVVRFLVEEAKANMTALNMQLNTPIDETTRYTNGKDLNISKYWLCISNLPEGYISPEGVLQKKSAACDDDKIAVYFTTTPLHKAARSGNLSSVQSLVDDKSVTDIDIPDLYRRTPLHLAVRYNLLGFSNNTLAIVRYLVEAGKASANVRDSNSQTPLHLAVRWKTLPVVRYLVEQGKASVTVLDKWSRTPLSVAVLLSRDKEDELIIKYLQCVNNLPEGYISPDGVLQKKSSACDDDKIASYFTTTPLHTAAKSCNLSNVQAAVKDNRVTDIDVPDEDGRTALHLAAQFNTLPVVRFLVEEANASVNAKITFSPRYYLRTNAYTRITTLHLAAKYNTLPVVRYLVEEAKANVTAEEGLSTRNYRDYRVVDYLLCIDNLPDDHFSPGGVLQKKSSECDDEILGSGGERALVLHFSLFVLVVLSASFFPIAPAVQ